VPEARLEAGIRLARSKWTTGCIDLSDGLATDLPHLLEGSGCGADIDVSRLPTAPGFAKRCRAEGFDPIELQVHGGEDYELLFARRPGKASKGAKAAGSVSEEGLGRLLGVSVRRIGRVSARRGVRGLSGSPAAHHF
jgi:thiamine-monophosphate kinase